MTRHKCTNSRTKELHEQSTSSGRHTQRRIHSYVRRQARTMGCQRPAFWRLGDLPPERIARRSEPAVRVAIQRLVRTNDPALERRWQDLGAGGQQVRLRRSARHAPVVRRHAASLGVQAGLASGTVADRSGHRLRRGGRRRPVPLHRRRPELAGTRRAARPRLGTALAARRRRHVPAHDPARSERSRRGSSSPSRPRARFAPTTAAKRGGRSIAGCSPNTFPTRLPRWATACTTSPCIPRARACCSCRSIGT